MCFRHGPIHAEFLEDYGHLEAAADALIELRAWQAHEAIASLADIAAMRVDAALGPCRLPALSTAVEMVRGMRARRKGLVPWP